MRTILFAIIFALGGLTGCAGPQPYAGNGYSGNYYGSVPYVPAGWANAYTPYMGLHGGRCYHHGFVQPTNDACLNGTIQTPVNRQSGVGGRSLSGMSPETAARLLAEFDRQENPCTARERTLRTSIGAFIGAIAGAIITRDDRGAVAGALIGAAGGNSEAVMNCQAYTETRNALLTTIDQYGCSGEVRRTNGVITDDERCNFRRSYVPNHKPPQLADRQGHPAAPRPRREMPRAEDLPPK